MKNNNKWFLRGMVSAGIIDQTLSSCDTQKYAVFSGEKFLIPLFKPTKVSFLDMTKFNGWLQGYIQRHG